MKSVHIGNLLLVLFLLVVGCKHEDNPSSPQQPATRKGVSLSPRSYDSAGFTDFFEKEAQAGNMVMWAGDWAELNSPLGAPVVVAELAAQYHYAPLIVAQFFTQSTGALLRPLDDSTRRTYLSGATSFAQRYQPEYLGFGIEVNILYEHSPADFDSFAAFFPVVCDSVKAHSPSTQVFTVFQLEKMKGLHGGLFGGTNDTTHTEWFLLDRFPRSDLIALTTYPALVFGEPNQLPPEYYSGISRHTTKPIAFTEIGWHSAASPIGWESSEREQADFVSRFFDLSNSLNLKFAIWSFLYDQQTSEPFNSMGLRRSTDGNAKLAWNAWIAGD